MHIVSTVGQPSETGEGKDYLITRSDGKEFLAVRSGQKFRCGAAFGAVGGIKALVQEDDESIYDSTPAESGRACPSSLHDQEDDSEPLLSPYDCVHPCALLIEASARSDVFDEFSPLHAAILRTLDSYGWLDSDGKFDYGRAERELSRIEAADQRCQSSSLKHEDATGVSAS